MSFQGGSSQQIPLTFPTSLVCAVQLNFEHLTSVTFASAADAVEVSDVSWKGIIKPKGFKIDLFIRMIGV